MRRADTPRIDFGKRGMRAALNMTEAEFDIAYHNKELPTPDSVYMRGPRWSAVALGLEIKKRIPAHLVGLEATRYALKAIIRAERAEGWHDE